MALDLYYGRSGKSTLGFGNKINLTNQISIGLGVLVYILIVDFPDKASRGWKFLTQEECEFVVHRINRDRLDAEAEEFTLRRFLKPALDIKIWTYAILFW